MDTIEIDIKIEKLKEQIRHFDKLIFLSEKNLRAQHERLSLEYSNDFYHWANTTTKQLDSLLRIVWDLQQYMKARHEHRKKLSDILKRLEIEK